MSKAIFVVVLLLACAVLLCAGLQFIVLLYWGVRLPIFTYPIFLFTLFHLLKWAMKPPASLIPVMEKIERERNAAIINNNIYNS